MKKIIIFLLPLLVSCTSTVTTNSPEYPSWGYNWCIDDTLYLSRCYADRKEVRDLQVNVQYYKDFVPAHQCLPSWDNTRKCHCPYVATHNENGYICDIYHTDDYGIIGNDIIIPLDSYVMFRYLPGDNSREERLVDIKVFRDFNSRKSTEFTLLKDEVMYSGYIMIY